jgi:hypothetical protein
MESRQDEPVGVERPHFVPLVELTIASAVTA